MEFEIKIIITNEYLNGNIPFDLNDFEQFIDERLATFNFGDSVIKYFWGFELYRFEGGFAQFFSNDIESWKHSKNILITNSHFDWDNVKNLDSYSIFELAKTELIKSIDRINTMKRKPKNFNVTEFRERIEKILTEYREIKNGA